ARDLPAGARPEPDTTGAHRLYRRSAPVSRGRRETGDARDAPHQVRFPTGGLGNVGALSDALTERSTGNTLLLDFLLCDVAVMPAFSGVKTTARPQCVQR